MYTHDHPPTTHTTHSCTHMCTHTCTHLTTHPPTHTTHTCAHTHVHTCAHTHTHMTIYPFTHTTHTHTHTYTHTHTHTFHRLLFARDDSFERVGASGPDYTISQVNDSFSENIFRSVVMNSLLQKYHTPPLADLYEGTCMSHTTPAHLFLVPT